jgi:hypothetical protein
MPAPSHLPLTIVPTPEQPVTVSFVPGLLALIVSVPSSSVATTVIVTTSFGAKLGFEAATCETPTSCAAAGLSCVARINEAKPVTRRAKRRRRRDMDSNLSSLLSPRLSCQPCRLYHVVIGNDQQI